MLSLHNSLARLAAGSGPAPRPPSISAGARKQVVCWGKKKASKRSKRRRSDEAAGPADAATGDEWWRDDEDDLGAATPAAPQTPSPADRMPLPRELQQLTRRAGPGKLKVISSGFARVINFGDEAAAAAAAVSSAADRPTPRPEVPPPPHNAGRGFGGRGRGAAAPRGRGRRWLEEEEEDEEEEGPGWWEVPREERNRAAALSTAELQPWQRERLMVAWAVGKRRAKIQELGAETGMDRAEVLAWFKQFQALPREEREALLAPLAARVAEGKLAAAAAAAAEAEARLVARVAAAPPQRPRRGGAPPPVAEEPQQPQLWAAQATPVEQQRPHAQRPQPQRPQPRLSSAASRTLEAVYTLTPYPSLDTVQPLCELIRVPRDVVRAWFQARRSEDGLPDNPRDAKRAAAAQQPPQQQQQRRPQPGAAAAGGGDPAPGVAPGAGAGAGGGAQRAAAPRVVVLTKRKFDALRSSLPSPRKVKGQRLADQMGVRTTEGAGGAPPTLEVGGVVYTYEEGHGAWRALWRRRRAARGMPGSRLDFQQWALRQGQQEQQGQG